MHVFGRITYVRRRHQGGRTGSDPFQTEPTPAGDGAGFGLEEEGGRDGVAVFVVVFSLFVSKH